MPPAAKPTLLALAALAVGLLSSAAQAALQGRDLNGSASSFEAYYDTVLDITWLADADYAKTSGYDSNGKMTWQGAVTWADGLSFTDGTQVYDNWRLPTVVPEGGANPDSELSYMFHVNLGNLEYVKGGDNMGCYESGDDCVAEVGPFINLQPESYWTATAVEDSVRYRWSFDMESGRPDEEKMTKGLYAWAVSSGDLVGVSAAVPETHTWGMMLAGLGLVAAAVRRRCGVWSR
jgi:hypothetical protein